MFGRRRHAAVVPAVIPAQLGEDQIFELVHTRIAEVLGEHGSWTVVRRTDTDTDSIFHSVLSHQIATDITASLASATRRLQSGPVAIDQPAAHLDPVTEDAEIPSNAESENELAAFSWQPAPITVWTDLRKPVTGELAQIPTPALVA